MGVLSRCIECGEPTDAGYDICEVCYEEAVLDAWEWPVFEDEALGD